MNFNCDASKTHFHNIEVALSLVLKVKFFGTRIWPISQFSFENEFYLPENEKSFLYQRLST